jgi:hypothetical protein
MHSTRWNSILGAACGLALLALGAGVANAQVNPANFRSGIVTGTINGNTLTTIPMFAVPSGMRFVLTDLDWVPSQANAAYQPALAEGAISVWVQDAATRWTGNAAINSTANQSFFSPNVSQHWTTGIVFEENQVVTLGLRCAFFAGPAPWTASWSGYLASNAVSAIEDLPSSGGLTLRAFPNPAGNRVVLQFTLARQGKATLAIYDAKGRTIRSLARGDMEAGEHQIAWDGRDARGREVVPGSYFARLETADETTSRKVVETR